MNIAAVILAAGRSSRFARGNKLLARIDGVPMIRRVALAVSQSRATEIVLVVAPDGENLLVAAGDGRWRVTVAHDAERGLSASLISGVAALPPAIGGVAVVLADMPGISAPLIDRLIAAFEDHGGEAIVFPQDGTGRQGHPVVWPRSLFNDLQCLTGDAGGKGLLVRHADRCRAVAIDDPGAYFDVDHEEDLAGRG